LSKIQASSAAVARLKDEKHLDSDLMDKGLSFIKFVEMLETAP